MKKPKTKITIDRIKLIKTKPKWRVAGYEWHVTKKRSCGAHVKTLIRCSTKAEAVRFRKNFEKFFNQAA